MGDNRSIPLGRVQGIPVTVSWSVVGVSLVGSWLLATSVLPRVSDALGIAWRLALSLTGVVFFLGSILAHEFGHALVARRHSIRTSSIRLWIFGGVAALSSNARTPRAEFEIATAGPAVNGMLAIVFYGAAAAVDRLGLPEAVRMIAVGLSVLNALLTVTNLVPAAPLDGGKVLSSILWARTGRAEWARLVSARVGLVAGAGVVAYGLAELVLLDRLTGFYTAAIGMFVLTAARADVVNASIRGRLAATAVSDVLWFHPPAVHDSVPLQDLSRVAGGAGSVPVQRWAHQTIGYVPTAIVDSIPEIDRSWTSVANVMTPVGQVPRAWTSESLLSAMERLGVEPRQLLGIDPATGQVMGTTTPRQFGHLLRQPRLWGGVGNN